MISITAGEQTFFLRLGELALHGLTPLINGQPQAAWDGEWCTASGRIERSGPLSSGPLVNGTAFGVLFEENPESGSWKVQYWLEGFPTEQDLDSFGLRFEHIDGVHAFLQSGYTSWDGSAYIDPQEILAAEPGKEAPAVGYALTQLLPKEGPSLLAGFEHHDRFQHTFTFHSHAGGLALSIMTLWDRKARSGPERAGSEALLLLSSPASEEGLAAWARRCAQASPLAPRLKPPGQVIKGWCSWYNLYAAISENNLREHLEAASAAADAHGLPRGVFQIDDGFTPEMGDWLAVRPQFPRGMQPLLDEIRQHGFIPGLWIAPFMVGNRSHLYRDHPDWVVQDRQAGGPLVQMRFYGEFRWHKRSEEYYILDITHPQAQAYIRRVFKTWREDWGCEYFKTDFMLFGSEHGPERPPGTRPA
jgi:alpha-galactosidase